MMQPERITFYAYADSPAEAAALQEALHDFVAGQYSRGVLVTAERLAGALRRFGNNPLIANYLKNG